ncbi:ferritin [Candidatus Liberibacter sp.]|uniref:ferritin n=1 Tax=Candidatus Liberibacter sp. TaxID=34022 RepID=UPI0015F40FD5|nr:ferritin [Candidatus Liberibacter sp.]MBA5723938.1 ferritin [Candidatus Liberibacter sp.]
MDENKVCITLNKLMNIEFRAHHYYLQAAAWAASHNLDGCYEFLLGHSQEEFSHMMRVFNHLVDLGEHAVFSDLPKPEIAAESIENLFSLVYQHEIDVTNAYDKAIEEASSTGNNQMFCFLQWFINEQREELNLCRHILDKIKLIGSGPHSLYLIDKEISKITRKS